MKDSLSRCDPELASEMRKNIVVCGGTSIARGIQQRLEKEFEGEDERYEFVLDWQRRYSAWIGGSMLGSLSTFQSLAIQLKEYSQNSENKSAVIYKKTFWFVSWHSLLNCCASPFINIQWKFGWDIGTQATCTTQLANLNARNFGGRSYHSSINLDPSTGIIIL